MNEGALAQEQQPLALKASQCCLPDVKDLSKANLCSGNLSGSPPRLRMVEVERRASGWNSMPRHVVSTRHSQPAQLHSTGVHNVPHAETACESHDFWNANFVDLSCLSIIENIQVLQLCPNLRPASASFAKSHGSYRSQETHLQLSSAITFAPRKPTFFWQLRPFTNYASKPRFWSCCRVPFGLGLGVCCVWIVSGTWVLVGNTAPCELASVVPFSNMCWVTSYFLLFHLYFGGEISSWFWSSHVQHQVARTTAGPGATAALAAAVAAAAAARAAEPLCLWPSMGNMINQINQSVLEVSRRWQTKLYRAWQLSNKQITGTIETWNHCFYIKCRLFRYRLSLLGSTAWIMVTSIGLQWPQAFVIPELVEAGI